MKLTTAQLVAHLEAIKQAVLAQDSFEGSLQYAILPHDMWEVGAFYRVGNTMGQGGCVLLEAESEPDCSANPTAIVINGDLVTDQHEIQATLEAAGRKKGFE